jgi:hypothetical protein
MAYEVMPEKVRDAATNMLRQHGETAESECEYRADYYRAQGNFDSQRVWKQIAKAVAAQRLGPRLRKD